MGVRKDTYNKNTVTYWVQHRVRAAMVNTAALTTTDTTTVASAVEPEADGSITLGRAVGFGDVMAASMGNAGEAPSGNLPFAL